MTQKHRKNQGEFYPLTSEYATKLRKAKLTAAEWRIWSYLIEVDPWGDRYRDLNTLTVLSECNVSKATFYRAIAKFQELKLFDFQDKGFSFKNEAGVSKMRQKPQECDSSSKNEAGVSKMRQKPQECENQPPEPLPQADSGLPQTIKTYTDYIQTLSDSERENFLEFGKKKAAQLPRPPELPLKWIEANWQELRSQWEKTTPAGQSAKNSQTDWTQHPDWKDWLAHMREGVPRFVVFGTCFDNKTRRAIADWADDRGLIWGTES